MVDLDDPRIRRAVSDALTVPGWTAADDAAAIAMASLSLPAQARIVEVGVFMGRCTVLLSAPRRDLDPEPVHCVDPFDCSGDPFSTPYYHEELARSGHATLEVAFQAHLARLALLDGVVIHRGSATAVAQDWCDSIDLLLLDGDQSPAGARAAYDAWVPFLRAGGLLILRNTRDREYAAGHDGHRRLAVETVIAPAYRDVLQVGATTIATRTGDGHAEER